MQGLNFFTNAFSVRQSTPWKEYNFKHMLKRRIFLILLGLLISPAISVAQNQTYSRTIDWDPVNVLRITDQKLVTVQIHFAGFPQQVPVGVP